MTLADHPDSRFSPSGNRAVPAMPAAQKRSWLDVLLHRPEPEPPPAPLPPRAHAARKGIDDSSNGAAMGRGRAFSAVRNNGEKRDSRPKPPAFVADLIVM